MEVEAGGRRLLVLPFRQASSDASVICSSGWLILARSAAFVEADLLKQFSKMVLALSAGAGLSDCRFPRLELRAEEFSVSDVVIVCGGPRTSLAKDLRVFPGLVISPYHVSRGRGQRPLVEAAVPSPLELRFALGEEIAASADGGIGRRGIDFQTITRRTNPLGGENRRFTEPMKGSRETIAATRASNRHGIRYARTGLTLGMNRQVVQAGRGNELTRR